MKFDWQQVITKQTITILAERPSLLTFFTKKNRIMANLSISLALRT
ncbi:MAG: hypothetical protein ACPLZD_09350 [Candidatus Saccharicenans sp.]